MRNKKAHGSLQGKVAVVTGSSSGIGQGIAKKFAEEGAKVVIDYIGHPEDADQTLKMMQAADLRPSPRRRM